MSTELFHLINFESLCDGKNVDRELYFRAHASILKLTKSKLINEKWKSTIR